MLENKFWEDKELNELNESEWESICTHCGNCCLVKLQDEDSDEIYYTNVTCRYFNSENCHCNEYQNRCKLVPACLKLTPDNIDKITWMPKTCAYRILDETGDLPSWHPLITGKSLADKYSVKGKVVSELLVSEDELENHIIEEYIDD